MVRSSTRMRVMAMRHSALLAQRLSRWRTLGPEDASTGLAPQSAANDASLRIRAGLSPAAMSSEAAVSGPTPQAPMRAGLARSHGAQGAHASHFVYGPPIEAIEGPFVEQLHTVIRPLGLSGARAMVESALEMRDQTAIDHSDDDEGLDDELRALVDQRIALLPGDSGGWRPAWPTEQEIEDLCAEFVAASGEALAESAETVARTVCRFAYAWCDDDPLCWSPRRVELLPGVWIPAKSLCDDDWHDSVESMFPLWLRSAAPGPRS